MEGALGEYWKRKSLDKYLNMNLKGIEAETDNSNRTKSIVKALILWQEQQVRYMHIAIGSVSMALVIWIIGRVWYDSWRATKLQVRLRPRKLSFLWELHPAESFPLILGFTSFFQTLTLVVIQALTLQTIYVQHCTTTAQIIFPTMFALSYMHLVFGFEMTIRSLRRIPFQRRGKWTTPICLAAFVVLMVVTWIPTIINPINGKCVGDIIWRPFKSSRTAIGIVGGLIFAFITMAAIIGIQLGKNKNIDMNERIAASRMVYYLVASALLQFFILPFFIQAVLRKFDTSFSSARVAEFILFALGLILALIHLILRANAGLFAIKPKETPWQKKRRFRLFGPNDLEIITISAPLNLVGESFRPDEKVQDIYARQQVEKGLEPPASVTLPVFKLQAQQQTEAQNSLWPLPEGRLSSPRPASPKTPTTSSSQGLHKKGPSYSVFPTESDLKLPSTVYSPPSASSPPKRPAALARSATEPLATLPSTKYSPSIASSSPDTLPSTTFSTNHRNSSVTNVSDVFEMLQPPSQPWTQGVRKHRRGSSTDSSATVQIGIRFSAFRNSGTGSKSDVGASSQDQPSSPTRLQRSRSDPNRPQHLPATPRPTNRGQLSPPFTLLNNDPNSSPQDSRSKDSRQPQQQQPGTLGSPTANTFRLNPVTPLGGASRAQRLYSPPLVKDGSNFF